MTVKTEAVSIRTAARPCFFDVTQMAIDLVRESAIANGLLLVSTSHTTCSVVIQEESHDVDYYGTEFLLQDLVNVLEEIVPTCKTQGQYLHPGPQHITSAINERNEEAWWSLNVDAHLRSVILGRSVTVPVVDGALLLGEFGRIFFADFDQTREREREVRATVMGE